MQKQRKKLYSKALFKMLFPQSISLGRSYLNRKDPRYEVNRSQICAIVL